MTKAGKVENGERSKTAERWIVDACRRSGFGGLVNGLKLEPDSPVSYIFEISVGASRWIANYLEKFIANYPKFPAGNYSSKRNYSI